ncbi:MAG: flotillin family protein [Firmicutes bacterium]|nr:flotillin family protein [Bacillota bacterium]
MLVKLIIAAVVIFIFILLLILGYVQSPPDKALIISGLRKTPRVLIGRAGWKVPFFERKDVLNLKLVSIQVQTSSEVPTADYINISVDAVANVKISNEPEMLSLASQNFLNAPTDYIASVAREVLEGSLREIVGGMPLVDMVQNREAFNQKVAESAGPDLRKMGLEVVNFNVQNFVDRNGVIENLGIDNVVKIKKTAEIARAESERDIAIAKANAQREAEQTRIDTQTDIAQRQNDLAIKQSELKKEADVKQAEADAAYTIQQEEQRKTIEVTRSNADIAKREMEVSLMTKEAQVKEQALNAEIKKKADAELYKRQQEAEAKRYEMEKEAEALKAKAAAEATAMRAKAEAEAEAIRIKGEAEAAVIKQKAVAEAEGIDKKAEAMKKMGEAAILEMYFNILPEVVKNAAEPLSKVEKITMYGESASSKLTGDIINTVTKVTDGVKESTGVDLASVISGFLGGNAAGKLKDIVEGKQDDKADENEAAVTEE